LIDTPGFDDTTRSDADILKTIAAEFCNLYDKGIKLDGVVYLHRISDPRMGGSALKNLHMFQRLCGRRSLPNVVLATTMWGDVKLQSGGYAAAERREEQLKTTEEFWGSMIRGGAHVRRHTNDRKSAEAIVSAIVGATKKIALDIQIEMVDKKIPLDQTSAGQYLKQEYADLRHRYEAETEEIVKSKDLAMQEKDEEMAAILNEEKSKATTEIAKAQIEDQKLKIDLRALQAEKSQLARELVALGNPALLDLQGESAKDPQLLAQEIEELQRSIEQQEELHRSEKMKQERQIKANATRASNVSAENEALTQMVRRLHRDKNQLERLVRTQKVRKPQGSAHHPHGERVVLLKTLRDQQQGEQQAAHQRHELTIAQSAASYSFKFWSWANASLSL
jgi:hypothetical protein